MKKYRLLIYLISTLVLILISFALCKIDIFNDAKITGKEANVLAQTFLIFTYLLFLIAIGSALFFAIKFSVLNLKKSTKGIIGIGILLIVMIVSFLIASNNPLDMPGFEKLNLTPATIKFSGASLICFYIFAAGTILAIIYSEIYNLLKNKNG